MSRTLALALLSAVTIVSHLAAASPCKMPPASNCTAAVPCNIPVTWFKDNQGCTESLPPHSDIHINHNGGILIVTEDPNVGSFTVGKFKKHPMPGGVCNWQMTVAHTRPFTVSPGGPSTSHRLTAKAGSDGCYTVNFKVGHTTIDPHIIVGGDNLISPSAVPSDH
jgi:hypothetical protein